ncbi:OmpA family protein [Reichenbachiella agarivorans]|uniref:OmpA family protein n=1 Tax=Reichenbachiella agarivorans TaxID=2979464 RepID=A0ABY6CT43_9BACT|nr:OmpA family protein [Reichenbachiella agarivorans]UXP33663.1 OmpA family protein [Reichenbachiella agarivorans]
MRKVLIISLLMLSCWTGWAQRPIYTMNQFTPLLVNPASPTYNYRAELSFFRDEITIASGDFLNTNSLNADYVFVQKNTGRRVLGVGINALSRDTGESDLLKTYNAGLSVATPIQLTTEQFLHFGINATYVNVRTSLDQLTTGSQWIASEFRYDPNAGLGEMFTVQQLSYLSLSAGLLWSLEKDGRPHSSAGLVIWDANRPNMSFFDEEARVSINYQIYAESILYERGQLRLTPSVYYQRTGQINSYTALFSTKLFFRNDNPYDIIRSGNIDLIMRYGFNQDASIGVVLNQPNCSFGFSYNFPLGKENQYFQSGLQVGVTISKLLWKPKTERIVIESVSSRRKFDFEQDRPVVYQQTEVQQMKTELEKLDKVKTLQFELSKDFHFEHGEAVLTESSYPFLDEVVALLKENPKWKLQIIGHTDNIGIKKHNYALSVERAIIVEEYLLSQGLPSEQISTTGRGDTEPIADNDTELGRAENRRVQFLIHAVNE